MESAVKATKNKTTKIDCNNGIAYSRVKIVQKNCITKNTTYHKIIHAILQLHN